MKYTLNISKVKVRRTNLYKNDISIYRESVINKILQISVFASLLSFTLEVPYSSRRKNLQDYD